MKTVRVLIAVVMWLGLPASPGRAQTFDAIYAFGDSLTDTWREPAEPFLHYDGRWSNGPLWVEYLSTLLGLTYSPSNNYAHSGAQADDTYLQVVNDFFPSNSISNSLCVVWAGRGNDFLQTYQDNGISDSKWTAMINHGIGNLSNALIALRDKGAHSILVPNTVDISRIPIVQTVTPAPLGNYYRTKVAEWNSRLNQALGSLRTNYPDLNLRTADVYAVMYAAVFTNGQYGFTVTDLGAIDDLTLLDKSFDGPGANYVFWDPVHPTTKAHAIIADRFLASVAPRSPRLSTGAATGSFPLTLTNIHVGRAYTIQQSADFTNWSNVATVMNYTSRWQSALVTNAASAAFYRAWFRP